VLGEQLGQTLTERSSLLLWSTLEAPDDSVLELLHPQVAHFAQPLAGEVALRRSLIETLSLSADYGVDVALLIDVAQRIGLEAMAEVDLGERVHRNRPLSELAPQARSVVRAILARVGDGVEAPLGGPLWRFEPSSLDEPGATTSGAAWGTGPSVVRPEGPVALWPGNGRPRERDETKRAVRIGDNPSPKIG
jgi:hypothetical protein